MSADLLRGKVGSEVAHHLPRLVQVVPHQDDLPQHIGLRAIMSDFILRAQVIKTIRLQDAGAVDEVHIIAAVVHHDVAALVHKLQGYLRTRYHPVPRRLVVKLPHQLHQYRLANTGGPGQKKPFVATQ